MFCPFYFGGIDGTKSFSYTNVFGDGIFWILFIETSVKFAKTGQKLRFSIITPNYNYAGYLPELLHSVVLQDYLDIEHIIVDDGSTDNSVEVIQDFVSRYPNRFKLITQKNAGQSAALNRALKEVTGDYIIWINSDDTFCENLFSELAVFFGRNPNVDIAFGDILFMDLKGQYIFRHRNQSFQYYEAALLGFTMFLSSNAVVWKSSLMHKMDSFKTDFKCNMDGEFFSRLFFKSTYRYLPISFSNFRKQPFSKAAENDARWIELMNRELKFELDNNLGYIGLASFPNGIIQMLRYLNRFKRAIFRVITLRNWKKKREMRLYENNRMKNE